MAKWLPRVSHLAKWLPMACCVDYNAKDKHRVRNIHLWSKKESGILQGAKSTDARTDTLTGSITIYEIMLIEVTNAR